MTMPDHSKLGRVKGVDCNAIKQDRLDRHLIIECQGRLRCLLCFQSQHISCSEFWNRKCDIQNSLGHALWSCGASSSVRAYNLGKPCGENRSKKMDENLAKLKKGIHPVSKEFLGRPLPVMVDMSGYGAMEDDNHFVSCRKWRIWSKTNPSMCRL